MNIKMLKAALAGLVLSLSSFANAGLIVNGADLVNPDIFLDFTEISLPDSSALTNQYSSFGIEFSGFTYNPCITCIQLPLRPDIGNFSNNNTGNWSALLSMLFPNNATDISFQFAFNSGASISALLNGSIVETIAITPTFNAVYGFTNILFDEIQFGATAAFLVDDVSFNNAMAVPEPSTLTIFALGIMGLASRRFKKQ